MRENGRLQAFGPVAHLTELAAHLPARTRALFLLRGVPQMVHFRATRIFARIVSLRVPA
jgi:hypothetical protein